MRWMWDHDCMSWKDKAKAMVKGGNPGEIRPTREARWNVSSEAMR